ncbi:MAG: DHH family phosphoesterase [Lachnospiraceae bacterium]|nr:DHH family phosphoesterase [Lachnospiraceae bacterium]
MKKNKKVNKNQTKNIKFTGKMNIYMQWPLWMTILLVLGTVGMFTISLRAGVFMLGLTVLYALIAWLLCSGSQKDILGELVTFATHYGQIQKKLLKTFHIPYALMDENGRLIWMNEAFMEVTGKTKDYHKSITTIFPQITKESFAGEDEDTILEYHVKQEEHSYKAQLQQISFSSLERGKELEGIEDYTQHLMAIYLFDETELNRYIKENKEQRFVAGLIYIDNYDEALESVEEVRQSLLVALIERKINKYISSFGGIVRRLEKDKYFIAIQEKNVPMLQEDKFSILEDVRSVNIGNDMAVTVSISLGLSGKTYAENYEYARVAMELALARGGNQAVTKEGDNITYFGGSSQQVDKNTRVKARVKAQALREFIQNNDKVVVMGHKIPDVDSFGAAIGIYRAAKELGKKAYIVVNEISASLRPMYESFVNNPNYEDDIFLTSAQAVELVDNHTVVVVVDVNRPSYTDCPEILRMSKNVVVIDHHRQGSENISKAVLSYVEPYASSACEMVAEILQYIREGMKIKNVEADCMYAGIMVDTDNFLTKTGVRTFEAAAFLRRCGADVTRVRKIFRAELDDYRARTEVVRGAEIYRGFAFAICNGDGVESPTILGAQAANELLNIFGVRASIVLTNYKGQTYVSARAIDEVNVQLIMEKIGGGGHANMAGAQLTCTPAEARDMIKHTIDGMIQEGELT